MRYLLRLENKYYAGYTRRGKVIDDYFTYLIGNGAIFDESNLTDVAVSQVLMKEYPGMEKIIYERPVII